MITLRDYQSDGVSEIRKFFLKGGLHVLFQGPTGSGKTIEFSYIAQNAQSKGKKVLILTDRTELLNQTGGTLVDFGINPFFIRAGTKYINFENSVYVAMCQTLRNRICKPMWANWIRNEIDLVIIDEAHKQDFNYLFINGILKDKRVIGFTATPKRTGKMRQLALDYEKIIESITVKELIELDYLVNDDYFGVAGANLENIKYDKMKGDYSEADMFSRFNSPTLYAGVVSNWLEVARNTKTLCFCVNIEHVIHTCEEFQKNGIDARFIVSKMTSPKEPAKEAMEGAWVRYEERIRLYELYLDKFGQWSGERNYMVGGFIKSKFPVFINAGILTTGFDCVDIETIIVNRATSSPMLWLQMIGRGSRPNAPFKTHFNLLDFGENAKRLGHYTSNQLWSLWHSEGDTGDGVAPVKFCGENHPTDKNGLPGCKIMILASYTICPFCGYIYPKKKSKKIELEALVYDTEKGRAIPTKKPGDMNLDELHVYFKIKRHKSPWLWRQIWFRGGEELLQEFGEKKGWRPGTIEKAINYVKGL